MRRASIGLTLLFGLAIGAGNVAAASSPKSAEPASSSTAPSDKLRLLLDLVQDPDIRTYLEQRRAVVAGQPGSDPSNTMAGGLGDGLQNLRNRVRALASAVPHLPEQFANAGGMLTDMLTRGDAISLALFLPAFVALGLGGEWMFRASTRSLQRWLLALQLQTARERVLAVFTRLAYSLGMITSYAIGSIGAFLLFDWSRGFKEVLLALLLASLFGRLAYVVGRFLLAPGAARFRVVPMGTGEARFLFDRLVLLGLLLGVGSQLIALLAAFGFDLISQELCADALGVGILSMMLEAVWRYPHEVADPADEGAEPAGPVLGRIRARRANRRRGRCSGGCRGRGARADGMGARMASPSPPGDENHPLARLRAFVVFLGGGRRDPVLGADLRGRSSGRRRSEPKGRSATCCDPEGAMRRSRPAGSMSCSSNAAFGPC